MGLILSLLTKLDAAVQRRVDSVCFFLMQRFGVRKSTLRYYLQTCTIFCFWGIAVGLLILKRKYLWLLIALPLLHLRVQGAYDDLEKDRRAESGNGHAYSAVDAQVLREATPRLKVFLFLGSLGSMGYAIYLDSLLGRSVFFAGCSLAFLGHLLLLYLAKTPMNPPAEKAREHVGTPRPASAET